MLHAVIMAGGSGTRFWPASRADVPKQLLTLIGSRTMLQSTIDRLDRLIPPARTLVVTNHRLAAAAAEQLPQLPQGAILGEPCKRDTAPCIGLAAHAVLRNDPDATMVVMPSDHVIEPDDAFQRAIAAAGEMVDSRPGRIVTFGIRPTYPAESFGYIQRGGQIEAPGGLHAYQVETFREKPDAQTARQYLDSGNFYWNSGIFIWRAKTILDALAEHRPQLHRQLQTIGESWGAENFAQVLQAEFAAIEPVSIDYAVMEQATDVAVIEAPFTWDDLGSWRSLARLRGADPQGNTAIGRHLGIDTRDTIIRTSDDHLVVTLGIDDLIVVHTPDATLVANKNQEERIRQVVNLLEEKRWREYL